MANKLLFNEQCIEIKCDRNDLESARLASFIPYAHINRSHTVYKTTIRNIDMVLKLFRNIDISNIDTLPAYIRGLYDKEINRRIVTKGLLELGPTNEPGWLWRHQQLGVELADVNNRFAFFYDTRTGKTPMSLKIISNDLELHPNHKWLVLCPLILIENAWLPDAKRMFPHLDIVSLHDSTRLGRQLRFQKNAQVYVNNIESFVDYKEWIEALKVDGCILDESSTMKSQKSLFGKAAVEYSTSLKRWYILSGEPAPNGEYEYYRQLQSVDFYGVHESWTQFHKYFFNDISRNPQYLRLVIKPEKDAELKALLKEYSIYVDKEDVLKTPGRDFIEIELQMPEGLTKHYHDYREKLYIELGENLVISSPSVAAKLNKLNQISSGFIIDTEAMKRNKYRKENGINEPMEDESYLLSEYRFDWLDTVLKTEVKDNQVIIWANYHKEFDLIKKHLGDKCLCIYGQTNITEKNEALRLFKEGKIQYLIANPKSADKGLTLTNAHFAIYFSMNYSYELYKQSMERIYGSVISQPNRCTYFIAIAKGTVDKAIYIAVKNKGDMSRLILDHLKGGL